MYLEVHNAHDTLKDGSGVKVTFDTNKNNSYKVMNVKTKKVEVKDKADTGKVVLVVHYPGKYKITVSDGRYSKSKTFSVKKGTVEIINKVTHSEDKNSEPDDDEAEDDSSKSEMAFGIAAIVGNDDMVADITVNSVQRVSPDDVSVTDISHNYEGMQQYVIVNYHVSAIKGDITMDDFDGSELSVADSNGTIGTASSNRDNGIPDTLSQGQNADLRIGIGLKHTGDNVTVTFNDSVWKGQITQ